jgi:Ca2+-binding EF-hand superfamily protein
MEQLKLAYKIFDQENKGYITKKDFVKVFKLLYQLIEFFYVDLPNGIDEYIENLFLLFDLNNDDKITKNEFLLTTSKHPVIYF